MQRLPPFVLHAKLASRNHSVTPLGTRLEEVPPTTEAPTHSSLSPGPRWRRLPALAHLRHHASAHPAPLAPFLPGLATQQPTIHTSLSTPHDRPPHSPHYPHLALHSALSTPPCPTPHDYPQSARSTPPCPLRTIALHSWLSISLQGKRIFVIVFEKHAGCDRSLVSPEHPPHTCEDFTRPPRTAPTSPRSRTPPPPSGATNQGQRPSQPGLRRRRLRGCSGEHSPKVERREHVACASVGSGKPGSRRFESDRESG